MPRLPPKAKQIGEDEVLRRWSALSPELRQESLTFHDEPLVGRVGAAFAALVQNNRKMRQMGISLAFTSMATNKLAEPSLLISCFHVSHRVMWGDEDSVSAAADRDNPVFFIDRKFVEDENDVLQRLRIVLPDFLSVRSGRRMTPAARWKDIFAKPAASVPEYQQQLAKLLEQAFWVLPSISPHTDETKKTENILPQELALEPWMVEADSVARSSVAGGKAARKSKQRRNFQTSVKCQNASSTSSKVEPEASDAASTRADSAQTPSEILGSDDEADQAQETEAATDGLITACVQEQPLLRQISSLSGMDSWPGRQMSMPVWVPLSGGCSPMPGAQYAVAAIVRQKNTFLDIVEGDELSEFTVGPKRRASSLPPSSR